MRIKSVAVGILLFAGGSLWSIADSSAGELESRLRFGGDLRVRILHEDARKLNGDEPGNNRLWQRYRARVWSSAGLTDRLQLNLRLVTEPRHYNRRTSDGSWIREEVLFDRLNLKFSNVLDLPLQLTVGRQGIEFADRWLVGEGTPDDGTRSDHFDAVRARWTFEEQKMTADVIWIEQRRDSAAWLPPVNDIDLDNRPQDERGIIAWLTREVAAGKFADGLTRSHGLLARLFSFKACESSFRSGYGRSIGGVTARNCSRLSSSFI